MCFLQHGGKHKTPVGLMLGRAAMVGEERSPEVGEAGSTGSASFTRSAKSSETVQ